MLRVQSEYLQTRSPKMLTKASNNVHGSNSSYQNTNGIFKFESIIDDQKRIGCYDNNIHRKVFSELEIFLKSIFYRNLESIYKLLSFHSNLYQELFDSKENKEQRNTFNIEYFEFDKNFSLRNKVQAVNSQQSQTMSQTSEKIFSVFNI